LVQYDYEKAEDNELELREGEYVTNIDMVDDDWWMGTNAHGESGLFPSNYVELVDDDEEPAPQQPVAAPAPAAQREPEPEPEPEPTAAGTTATAQFDYEAAEDNGMYPVRPLRSTINGWVGTNVTGHRTELPRGRHNHEPGIPG
jgi:hypothetical protein